MPKIGLTEAARLTGKASSTIVRASKKTGGLSAEKDSTGRTVYDVAELERFFGSLQASAVQPDGADALRSSTTQQGELRVKLGAEEEKSRLLQAQVEDLRGERDRLLALVAEQTTSIRLLSDQRIPAPTEPEKRGVWQRLFGG